MDTDEYSAAEPQPKGEATMKGRIEDEEEDEEENEQNSGHNLRTKLP